ncbi:DksA/TraR family C4-type zinc finger protein [Paracoccus sediminis]|uniref:DksA/TraR family C4-type zinc finger protein n=1 Tax=Paracoccus sediminis TaxID=1214787 RepID=A0A238X719_9RHOB|nr:DksA/TraR family C4-type zinc finger protein [Paracoccus sediminis]TBN49029.1 DksA/TraR family C4-type zinc finger protein [Paracoccus sediminis]SNR54114.1 transcriptional regulator, TraR/DksA family [Paracoccus sediminis]
MAGGWARDDAVNDQIEISTAEAVARARLRATQAGARVSALECVDCGEPIPEPRRLALPGVQLCVECQGDRDRAFRPLAGINRRGSKDSQLK